MSTNTSCTDTSCPELCCTLSGNCINPNSTEPAERECKFYYNETVSETREYGRGLKQLKIRQNKFPAYYAVPLIVVGSILIVVFCVIVYKCWKKKKQEKEPKDNQSSEGSKPTSAYHQAFSQSSASDLIHNGISEKNLIPPPSAINQNLYQSPHALKKHEILENPHMQMNYQEFQVPLHSMNESLKKENEIERGNNKFQLKTQE